MWATYRRAISQPPVHRTVALIPVLVGGVYQGNGVLLPVPDGWTIDPVAMQQGVVAAVSDDGTKQLTARALDTESAAAGGQDG